MFTHPIKYFISSTTFVIDFNDRHRLVIHITVNSINHILNVNTIFGYLILNFKIIWMFFINYVNHRNMYKKWV